MPQIQEYMPQTEEQGPVGGTSPNIELAGSVGRSIERLGGVMEEVGGLIHRRQAQEETSNVYSDFANQRAVWTEQVRQQAQTGTLDIDKIKEDYDNSTGKLGDNLNTPEGRNYFQRQQSRLRGHIIQMAQASQAQVAANSAKGSWQNAIALNSSTLMKNPDQFEDIYHQGLEAVDQLIATGGLPEKMRDQAIQQMSLEYTKGAIRGWAELDPDHAKQMIDKGAFDQFLNSDQKHQMQMEVSHYAQAQEVEGRRADKAVEDARKASAEKWGQDSLPKLVNNSLSTKDVLEQVKSGALKWEEGERWINMIDKGAKEELRTDPRVKNALIQRVVDPNSKNPITDTADLMPYVGHGISISDLNSINSLMNKTPDGQAAQQGERALFNAARSTIRFKNPMTQQYDTLGEDKLARFMTDYAQAKKSVKEAGGTYGDLVNPSSPLYFGKTLENYQTSMQDQMAHASQGRTDKALGITPKEPGQPAPKPVDKNVRKPGESAADYLKRRGLGG